ncbi:hypothetical protein CEXT_545901, partial [Caerostris extrusa]
TFLSSPPELSSATGRALLPAAAEPCCSTALKIIVCAFETQFASGSELSFGATW